MRLKGKTALIAGASRNIGREIALTFAREGADLALVARQSTGELREVAGACERLGVQARPYAADISRHEEVNQLVAAALAHFGKIDVVVCCAAIRPHKPFWEIDYEEWHRVMGVNMHSTFYLAKALAPSWIERRQPGSIIALGGVASLTAQPRRAHVVASKTGLYGLIKSLALELGPYGVRANLIAVGLIGTERRNPEWYPEGGGAPHGISSNLPDGTPAVHAEGSPLGRLGTPSDVARVACFLASDDSAFVTGDRIVCAGGRYM